MGNSYAGNSLNEIREEMAADGRPSGVEEEIYSPYPFDSEKISITSRKISLSNVVRRLERKLIRAAEIQRDDNLWDLDRKSRLIESLMLKIPLPLFYAAADKNDDLIIVDGLQRISAIRQYVLENKFKLASLEFLSELEGKKFNDLPENMKIRIDETELDFVIINPDSPPEVQRNIFKRLNTGGLPLTEQEIRHALYNGPATKLLKELVNTKEFQSATTESVQDSRMAAQELVLRFLAFSILGIEEYRKNEEMDSFLSDTMQIINKLHTLFETKRIDSFENRRIKNCNLAEIEEKFSLAMTRSVMLFDDCAFRISTPARIKKGVARTPINKSLFEVWSVLLSDMPESQFDVLGNGRDTLFKKLDDEFEDKNSLLRRYIGQDSTKISGVKGRYDVINKIINELVLEVILS